MCPVRTAPGAAPVTGKGLNCLCIGSDAGPDRVGGRADVIILAHIAEDRHNVTLIHFPRDRYVDIPEEVLDVYRLWRPSPLFRAHRLERALGTPAKIYCKYEGGSPAGSHKPNTAVAQAYYNAAAVVKPLTTETPSF